MTPREILHELLPAFDPYLSCGVPEPAWTLALKLTQLVYGDAGVALMMKYHKTHDDGFEHNKPIILYTIDGWDNDGDDHVDPEVLIGKLEDL